jgi:carbamoyl-phosphate synthase small subunit
MDAILALEDGKIFKGRSFTGPGQATGEVIFNTGMTGYQEILTDPSYHRQMVCLTFPQIGNYGVNDQDIESSRIQVAALIVKECCRRPSNWQATSSLPDYLQDQGVFGLEGIDTRALTRHIRINGAMRGCISTNDDPAAVLDLARSISPMQGLNLAGEVTCSQPFFWTPAGPIETSLRAPDWPGSGPRLAVFDFGIKFNILREIVRQGIQPLVLPADTTADQVRSLKVDGVFLSNGPGDPEPLTRVIGTVRDLAQDLPVSGICLGHQLLALALGGRTYKLKFGHHGCNHPVQDLKSGAIEISSQNHGFCADVSGLSEIEPTHINLNDQTLEGFEHRQLPLMAVQYHPEAAPGPSDAQPFFVRLSRLLKG